MAFEEYKHTFTHTHTHHHLLYTKSLLGFPRLLTGSLMSSWWAVSFFFLKKKKKERYREKSVFLYYPFSLSFDGGHKASVVTFIRGLILCVRGAIKYTRFIRRLVWIGHLKIRHVLLFIFLSFCLRSRLFLIVSCKLNSLRVIHDTKEKKKRCWDKNCCCWRGVFVKLVVALRCVKITYKLLVIIFSGLNRPSPLRRFVITRKTCFPTGHGRSF